MGVTNLVRDILSVIIAIAGIAFLLAIVSPFFILAYLFLQVMFGG